MVAAVIIMMQNINYLNLLLSKPKKSIEAGMRHQPILSLHVGVFFFLFRTSRLDFLTLAAGPSFVAPYSLSEPLLVFFFVNCLWLMANLERSVSSTLPMFSNFISSCIFSESFARNSS
jgi:hypothetical protein